MDNVKKITQINRRQSRLDFLKHGDTLVINGLKFKVLRFNPDRIGLSYLDKDLVSHIRWISYSEALKILMTIA